MAPTKSQYRNINILEKSGYIPGIAYIFIIFFIPLIYLFIVSLWQYDNSNFYNTNFTLENYVLIFTDKFYVESIFRTVKIGLIVTFICLSVAFPLALFLNSASARIRSIMMALLVAPLFTSVVIRVFGWQILLKDDGLVTMLIEALGWSGGGLMGSSAAVVIGIVHVELPFMVFPILAALRGIPSSVMEASRTLGASPFTTMRTVALPLAMPGIVSGCTLVFSISISAFVQPLLLGGASYFIIPTVAYHEVLTRLNFPLGAALGFTMLFIAIGASLLLGRLGRKGHRA